jgi:glycosyltransferase involved in cell wall biosynthesis
LHLDHQYEAAEAHIQEGLGENAALIRVPQLINTEAQYKALWADQFDKPTISICCTAYNHERTITDTLKGFLSQHTKFPFEILIHDDASTDNTQRIIKQWQQQYPHIIKPIYQTQNQYSQGKRPLDLLLKKARGKYIALCEGDDYWISPQKLEIQVDLLHKQPDFVCVGHSFYQLEEFDLKVFPFEHHQQLMVLEAEELMAVKRLFWINALVFRKDFDEFPPERKTVPLGDQFITSFLGNFGKGLYLDQFIGSVARRNPFSVWTPLSQQEKNKQRFITKLALAKMHNRMGHIGAVDQILSSIEKSVA